AEARRGGAPARAGATGEVRGPGEPGAEVGTPPRGLASSNLRQLPAHDFARSRVPGIEPSSVSSRPDRYWTRECPNWLTWIAPPPASSLKNRPSSRAAPTYHGSWG